MKPRAPKTGFTIIELLTVMSIIVVLIGILVPSMNAIRRYSKVVAQKNQFHDISKCLETFAVELEYGGYPDSSPFDANGDSYCGAMKLCEAMVGQDSMGLHQDSLFLAEGTGGSGGDLYYVRGNQLDDPPTNAQKTNLRNRWRCMEGENVQVASLTEIYGSGNIAPFQYDGWAVLCDMYKRYELRNAKNEKLGMPVLYYRADNTQLTHQPDEMATNIYRYSDNHELLELQPPWTDANHPLYDPSVSSVLDPGGDRFYEVTTDPDVVAEWGGAGGTYPQPYKKDSFILISAGWDGLYGTRDDVFNFEKTK